MELLIEGEKINYSIENEKNVKDIVNALSDWLNENNRMIKSLSIDGAEIQITDEENLIEKQIDDVQKLEINLITPVEIAYNSLYELKQYVTRFVENIENTSDENNLIENKQLMLEGINWVLEIIDNSCQILHIEEGKVFYGTNSLYEIKQKIKLKFLEINKKKYDNQNYIGLLNEIASDLKILNNLIPILWNNAQYVMYVNKEIYEKQLVEQKIEEIENVLNNFLPLTEEIGTFFQTGNDKVGLDNVNKILGVLENLIFFLNSMERILKIDYKTLEYEGEPVENKNKELFELIDELYNAFKDKDLVLLSDLLEYELGEKFTEYKEIVNNLKNELPE